MSKKMIKRKSRIKTNHGKIMKRESRKKCDGKVRKRGSRKKMDNLKIMKRRKYNRVKEE